MLVKRFMGFGIPVSTCDNMADLTCVRSYSNKGVNLCLHELKYKHFQSENIKIDSSRVVV